ncbi:hypothetical protein ACN47E_004089 [Coniothyrium glycines]
MLSVTTSPFHPMTSLPQNHWQHAYLSWQTQQALDRERQHQIEAQRLRIFGGIPGDSTTLLEPMLKVVTDLFDGFTDYQDP